jgi:hypothetical protein
VAKQQAIAVATVRPEIFFIMKELGQQSSGIGSGSTIATTGPEISYPQFGDFAEPANP